MKFKIIPILFFSSLNFCAEQSWTKQVFTYIYSVNHWGDTESVSGHGSKLSETLAIRSQLPAILKQLNIKSILDLPCGDFNWMKTVDLHEYHYIGADIVSAIISKNQ